MPLARRLASSSGERSKWSLHGGLAAAGDDDDVGASGGDGFLDAVLNQRLIDQWKHLLRGRLGGGKEAGTHTRGGDDCFANCFGS